jgi:hypothetical protein
MQAHPTAMLSPGRAEGTPDYPGLFCSRAWTGTAGFSGGSAARDRLAHLFHQ